MTSLLKLFTDHDIFNIHKILGFGCLAHYGYRIYNKFVYGSMLFDPSTPAIYLTPAIHLSLSLSSFIFQVPKNRFNCLIIIWKELQLHNIIFTSRSVFMMYHTLYFTPNTTLYYYTRLGIMLTHHYLADLVTRKYQVNDKTTTRDMPYDLDNKYLQYALKKYYAVSQMLALFALTATENYEHGFLVMFPIQLSTFLMTLVRKSIISNNTFHMLYSMSLAIPYMSNMKSLDSKNDLLYFAICFVGLRLIFRLDKYINMIGLTYFYTSLNHMK